MSPLTVRPLTPELWPALEELFGPAVIRRGTKVAGAPTNAVMVRLMFPIRERRPPAPVAV